jgi:phosphopantothenoylcysteine decarboxylase/phosphopantothenate--cysteine ligase
MNDKGAGFGFDTNKITMIDKNNNQAFFELKSKTDVAKDIVARVISEIETRDEKSN